MYIVPSPAAVAPPVTLRSDGSENATRRICCQIILPTGPWKIFPAAIIVPRERESSYLLIVSSPSQWCYTGNTRVCVYVKKARIKSIGVLCEELWPTYTSLRMHSLITTRCESWKNYRDILSGESSFGLNSRPPLNLSESLASEDRWRIGVFVFPIHRYLRTQCIYIGVHHIIC